MNAYQELDIKLKALIHLSKNNNDSRRAAVVFYMLIRRVLNEKGIRLGFVPLISKKERRAFEYMNAINSVMENNYKFQIFNEEMVNKVQKYELLYLRNPMSFSFDSLKELIKIYYNLRKMDIPNIYHALQETDASGASHSLQAYKFLAKGNNGQSGLFFKKNQPDPLKQYLSLDLDHKEVTTQNKLKQGYDKDSFEQLLQLKKIRQELKENSSGKITFKGSLKDNFLYQQSLNEIPGYFLLGLAVVSMMISIVLFIQELLKPEISGSFTLISFLLFGVAILIGFVYWKLFYMEAKHQ